MTLRKSALIVLAAVVATLGPTAASARAGVRRDRPSAQELPGLAVGDRDGDGLAEGSAAWRFGFPCACRCPLLVAGTTLEAAGQQLDLQSGTALVVCGTRFTGSANPNTPDPGAPVRIEPHVGSPSARAP